MAYSPLGRGFLTGNFQSPDDFAENDYRRFSPRFQGENFDKNLELVDHIKDLAASKGCTPAQLALAWLLAKKDYIVPIPGTKHQKYLAQNAEAVDVSLTKEEMQKIDEIAPVGVAAGMRYPEQSMKSIDW